MWMHQGPKVFVCGLKSGPLSGIGVPPTAAALANAIFAVTGYRIRKMPFWNHIDFAQKRAAHQNAVLKGLDCLCGFRLLSLLSQASPTTVRQTVRERAPMAENELRPIIIKKKKVISGGGHHGGAWKVAYADFVTAMMAFFMLMWLLNATTESQRKGLADYFSPTIPIARISGGGDGAFGGESPFSEEILSQDGTGATSLRPTEGRQALGLEGTSHDAEEEEISLAQIQEALAGDGGDSVLSDLARPHIETRLTDEGLVIEVFSRPGQPIFNSDTGMPQPWLVELAVSMASLFGAVTNGVAVEAHIAAEPLVRTTESGWQRTTERAQIIRALLEGGGLHGQRVSRVTGHSDREPAVVPPISPRNDRVEVILLRERY